MYDLEGFCIKQEKKMNYIHKVNNKVIINQYINHRLNFEITILSDCKILSNVILSLNKELYIIYVNLKGQLILTIFNNNEIKSSTVLVNGLLEHNKIQTISLNNILNIFYIKKFDKKNVLCFRRLNSNAFMSPEIIIDILEPNLEIPYILNINNEILSIAYVKPEKFNYVGYRIFNNKENKWSEFIILDANSTMINDINFIKDNNHIAYTYSFIKNDSFNLVFGIGDSEIKKRIIDKRNSDIKFSNIQVSSNGNLNIIIVSENKIKIIETCNFNSSKLILESNLKNIDRIEKYYFEFNNRILKNRIIIFKTIDGEVFTDDDFIENKAKKLIKKNEEESSSEENDSLKNNIIMTEEELKNEIKEKIIDKEYVNKLIIKIEGYEEIINKFMNKFTEIEDDREKLHESIDLLNDNINKKNIQISEFEIRLSENQDLIDKYKTKIHDIEELNKKLSKDHLDEILNLKQLIKQKEEEICNCNEILKEMNSNKNNNLIEISSLNETIEKYKSQIKSYNINLNELKIKISENEERVNDLSSINNELNNLNNEIKEKSNEEINSLKKLINKIKVENMRYVNQIEELNLQLNELNDTITAERQEKLKYINEIKILNIKMRELNRIRRNGFM